MSIFKISSVPILHGQSPYPAFPHPRRQDYEMVSDSTTANNICEWITIIMPNTIQDSESSAGQAWLAALQALVARENCDSFQNCYRSRATEDDTQLFVWISWANKTAYDLYAGSTVSYAPICFDLEWPSITILYFDRPLTESRRRKLRTLGVMNNSAPMMNLS
jgi:hypothetical protein